MKSIWLSKTMWFNALTVVAAALAAVIGGDLLSPEALKLVVILQSVVNIGLRLVTNEQVKI